MATTALEEMIIRNYRERQTRDGATVFVNALSRHIPEATRRLAIEDLARFLRESGFELVTAAERERLAQVQLSDAMSMQGGLAGVMPGVEMQATDAAANRRAPAHQHPGIPARGEAKGSIPPRFPSVAPGS